MTEKVINAILIHNTNPFGELEITTNDGNILINPRYANQIIIKTE